MSSLRSNTPDPDDSGNSILGTAVDIQGGPSVGHCPHMPAFIFCGDLGRLVICKLKLICTEHK